MMRIVPGARASRPPSTRSAGPAGETPGRPRNDIPPFTIAGASAYRDRISSMPPSIARYPRNPP